MNADNAQITSDNRLVCCLSPFDETEVRGWFPPDVTLRMVDPTIGPRDLQAACTGATVVIGDLLHRAVLDRHFLAVLAPGAFVQQPSVGYDTIDVPTASQTGVTVANAAGYNSDAVADWVVAALYSLVRGLHWRDAQIRKGQWPDHSPARELSTLTVGLLGFGNVGHAIAQRLTPIVDTVLYHDLRKAETAAAYVSQQEVLERSDVLSVQLPLTPATRGLIGADELNRLPEGALLINAGRGGVVDEQALADAVTAGHLAGAALDVFADEPLKQDSPLLACDRVLLSPHIAGDTVTANDRLLDVVRENVQRVLTGWPPEHMVTSSR
ncbi:NAD(P)-dependent oxidoreductase [Saccharopolyspora phatthalungensis]|uniref:D-3-phosphoglycerate dehydrogenase n=1 Tax=Saccharopolyspora phatthalungensis TaxID=664693 RepID=A0A840Q5K6_9PSEU|nr:NAD(P)-dependent oxidoreductase [Saccharopolyspora phatthalungensis]MBB5153655.1 D-3-phosphoglycerate dehydrogenase [Saccharopolyspora phatthalungensis]